MKKKIWELGKKKYKGGNKNHPSPIPQGKYELIC